MTKRKTSTRADGAKAVLKRALKVWGGNQTTFARDVLGIDPRTVRSYLSGRLVVRERTRWQCQMYLDIEAEKQITRDMLAAAASGQAATGVGHD